jgi:hypothetical protein
VGESGQRRDMARERQLIESQDAEGARHTLPGDVLDARFSWCLSRRLRKRETPELFMMVLCTHAGWPWLRAHEGDVCRCRGVVNRAE